MFLVCCLGILGSLMVTKKSRGFLDSPKIQLLERSLVFSVRNFWGTSEWESDIYARSDGYILEFRQLVVCSRGYLAEKKSTCRYGLI